MSKVPHCTGCGEYPGEFVADRIEELEAKLAKALELAEEAFDFNIEDDGPRAWHSINDRIEELKGQDDE
jgi:hypothetical protein